MLAVYLYRKNRQQADVAAVPEVVSIEGRTMGTTYHIKYFDARERNLKPSVDSLLAVFNASLSTYLPDSEISQFNKGASQAFRLPFFPVVLTEAQQVHEATAGAFDPTVMPLINAWGFGPAQPIHPDSAQIDSIKQFVGFDKIYFNGDSIWKEDPRTQLDFSAIAKGYGVDVVAAFIKSRKIENLFVEIGGEVVTAGKNIGDDRAWVIGILNPHSTLDHQYFIAQAVVANRAVATSGNYFNYREEEGRKYSHTLDPSTGYPIQRDILSASVFAADCKTADAWATACMVVGAEKAIALIEQQPGLEGFITFSTPDGSLKTYATPGLSDDITLTNEY